MKHKILFALALSGAVSLTSCNLFSAHDSTSGSIAISSSTAQTDSNVLVSSEERPPHTKKIGSAAEPFSSTVCQDLKIYTIEMVNQYGDSVLIHCGADYADPQANHSDDFNMLIDAGQSADTGTNGLVGQAVSDYAGGDLDVVLFTHGHADHIGGMPGLFKNADYDVDMFIDFGYIYGGSKGDAETVGFKSYRETREKLIAGGTNYCTAVDSLNQTGVCSTVYHLAPELTFEILDTGHYVSDPNQLVKNDDCNNTSIAGLLRYKDFTFLTTGDLDAEEILVKSERLPKDVTLFKAAHHCSDTSNSSELLAKIMPEYVVISSACLGAFSSYQTGSTNVDHPNPTALKRIFDHVDKNHVFLNMTMGTIVCDIDVNKPKVGLSFKGCGAHKMKNPAESDSPSILDEKDLPLVETFFYNFTLINYSTKNGGPSTLADRTGVYPD